MNTGRVFDISRGCVDDGPGYRTVVFLKGCNLDCPWCHNPEGKSFDAQIAFDASRCIGCSACREACTRTWQKRQTWRDGCTACGRCAEACPSGARRLVGRTLTVDELVAEVAVDADFFKGTGGGVTFSGGEPLAQPEFVFTCSEAFRRKGLHVAVETSGFWPGNLADGVSTAFDLVLFDLKHVNPDKFRQATKKDLGRVLDNLAKILASTQTVEIRLTLIPGFNDSPADLAAVASFLKSLPRRAPLTLQPFHRLATSKEAIFNCTYPWAGAKPTDRKELAAAAQILADQELSVVY